MSTYTRVKTQLGTIALGFSPHGLTRVLLPGSDWAEPSAAALKAEGLRREATPPPSIARVAEALVKHVEGKPQDFRKVPLDATGVSEFLLRVQREAQKIPAGKTRTYGELGARIGSPGAARAVGRAMATNRWPIVVPCHRVFASNGFGEYSAASGLHTKLRLLWREGYRGRTSNVAFDEHAAVAQLAERDPRLRALFAAAGPLTLQLPSKRVSPFVALGQSIVSQQLSTKAAHTIYGRVAALFGSEQIDDPKAVLSARHADLRGAGLSEAKARSLVDLAQYATSGKLPTRTQLNEMSDEEIVEALVPIRGIGRWSVEMLLIFQLGRPNVLPVADLGVQKGFQLTHGGKGKLEAMRERWAPYASVASWYMWRACEIERGSLSPTYSARPR